MTTENPHLRAIAIAGALALAAVALGMWTLNRQQPAASASEPLPVHTTSTAATTATTTTSDAAKAKPAAPAAKAKAKPAAVAKAKPAAAVAKPKPKPRPKPNPYVKAAHAAGLPGFVASQFGSHEVVVVTLFSPVDDVDRSVEAEAEAGAALGGAGFAPVDVLRNDQTAALTKLLGVLSSPGTLVFNRKDYTQPVTVLDGFADKETVAQAALNADPTPGGVEGRSAWAEKANALCLRSATELGAFSALTPAESKAAAPKAQKAVDRLVDGLGKLTPPPGRGADVSRFVALVKQDGDLTMKAAAAGAGQDPAAAATAQAQEAPVAAEVSGLAADLGAPSCAHPFS